jgi:hypothetical protein
MAKCDKLTFVDFSDDCIQALRRRVQSEGVEESSVPSGSTSGTASRAGFDIAWTYDPPTQTLTVECTNSPFFAPCKVINAQITSWINSCYPA